MRLIFLLTFLFSFASYTFSASDADDNIIIDTRIVNYTLRHDKGKLKSVKISDTSTYLAQRADGKTAAVTFYGDGITIDKASAPDSKPVYRAWKDDDLFYTGSRVCALPLALKKGKPAKVIFERTYTSPEQFCQIMLPSAYFTRHAEFTITVPWELAEQFVFTPQNLPENAQLIRTQEGNNTVYKISLDNVKPLKAEKMAPSADFSAPQILVKGYFTDINDIYSFLRDKLDENENSAAVNELALKLCENKPTVLEKIDTIAAWVRNNIRYVAIEHGEYGLRPDFAENVLTKRYGDCKGSANLIRSMLRAVGIDGRLVWIGTRGDVAGNWTELVSLAAGNHQIAAAVVNDSIIYIDGTTSFSPKGLVPSAIAGQQCMVLNGDNVIVDTVPHMAPYTNVIRLAGDTRLENDILCGEYTTSFRGEMRMSLESTLNAISAPKRSAALGVILAFDRNSATTDNISLSSQALDAEETVAKYNETDKGAVKRLSDGKTYIQLRPFRAASFPLLEADGRRNNIFQRHPYDLESNLSFTLPEGYSLDSLPNNEHFSNLFFEGSIEYTHEPNSGAVLCKATLKCINGEAPASEVESWNNAVKQIRNLSSSPIILQISENQ